MDLAKPALDVGLFTNRLEEMTRFCRDELGSPFEEMLPTGGGVRQHRFGLSGSVLKVNHARDPLREAPTGFRRLVVAREGVEEPRELRSPDGLAVDVVPQGYEGVDQIAIHWATSEPDLLARFLTEGFGGERVGAAKTGERYRVGHTLVVVRSDVAAPRSGPLRALGFRYVTVQVRDVQAEHARLVALGAEEARAPVRLRDVAMISFIRDPDGNWIEISQRASLTGPLPEQPGA